MKNTIKTISTGLALAAVLALSACGSGTDSSETAEFDRSIASINRCVEAMDVQPLNIAMGIDAIAIHTDPVASRCNDTESPAMVELRQAAQNVSDTCKVNDGDDPECKRATDTYILSAVEFLEAVEIVANHLNN